MIEKDTCCFSIGGWEAWRGMEANGIGVCEVRYGRDERWKMEDGTAPLKSALDGHAALDKCRYGDRYSLMLMNIIMFPPRAVQGREGKERKWEKSSTLLNAKLLSRTCGLLHGSVAQGWLGRLSHEKTAAPLGKTNADLLNRSYE